MKKMHFILIIFSFSLHACEQSLDKTDKFKELQSYLKSKKVSSKASSIANFAHNYDNPTPQKIQNEVKILHTSLESFRKFNLVNDPIAIPLIKDPVLVEAFLVLQVNSVKFNEHTEELMKYAAIEGSTDVLAYFVTHHNFDINMMLKHGVFNQDNSTLLHWAAYGGQPKLIKWLLAHGATVNAVTRTGNTPLHEACCSKRNDFVKAAQCLIEHGADISAVDSNEYTPLRRAQKHFGISDPDPQQVQQLIDLLRKYKKKSKK